MAPSGSVDITYSSFAQHWLSEGVPCPLPAQTGALWGNQLGGLAEYEDIHARWSEASRKDWDRFLTLRADEMRQGGIVVLLIQSSHLDGSCVEHIAEGCQIAKRRCVEEGVLTEEEAEQMCVPEYAKNMFEILEPLKSRSETWEILEVQQQALPCALMSGACDGGGEGIKARRMVNLGRSFMDASLERAFARDRKESKLDAFWDKVMDIGSDDASRISSNFGVTFLALRRK